MKRTHISTVVVLAVVGAVVGFLVQALLAGMSFAKVRPEYTLGVTLVLIAAIVIAFALPIRRATHGTPAKRVDPFYATRVVVLAKACSIGGALLGGFALGVLIDLLVKSGSPPADSYLRAGAMLVGAVILVIAGLLAEFFCTVPPQDDDDTQGAQGAHGAR